MAKRYLVTQTQHAKYALFGRKVGEKIEDSEMVKLCRWRWTAKLNAALFRGTSSGGLLELRTTITEIEENS